jgi:hypothetical protein
MADNTTKEQLDMIVQTIGFGIVSDFRQLSDAMLNVSSDIRNNSNIIGDVNRNLAETSRTLSQVETNIYRQRDARKFRQLESQLENRLRLNGSRNEETMRRIADALDKLQKQGILGGAGGSKEEEDTGGGGVGFVEGLVGGLLGGKAGSFLKGAAKTVGKAGKFGLAVGAVAAVGAAGSYLMGSGSSEEEQAPDANLSPSAAASGSTGAPTVASDTMQMGDVGLGAGATVGAAAIVERTTRTARQKAISKVLPKVPSYLSKFGGKLATTIGLKSIPIFGALVGGYFSFSRFMSGDTWTSIGAEFVSGVAPNVGGLGGPAGYVAGVSSALAIQAYLITRDIYNEVNAIDIRNNVVPNFDDLTMSEKTQVVKDVGAYVESYVNSLLGRAKTGDAAVANATASSTAGAGSALPPPSAAPPGAVPAATPSAAPPPQTSGPPAPETQAPAGVTTDTAAQAGAALAPAAPPNPIPDTPEARQQMSDRLYGPTSAGVNETVDAEIGGGVSPSDTAASFSTQSNLGGDITAPTPGAAGTYRPTYPLTEADLSPDVINVIAGEARMSDPTSYYAVINNMMNRVGGRGYGPSGNLRQVARAPGQYAGYRKASPEEQQKIIEAIKAVAAGNVPDNTNGSTEFRARWYMLGEGRGKTAYRTAVEQGFNDQGGNVYFRNPKAQLGPYAAYSAGNTPPEQQTSESSKVSKPMAEGATVIPLPSDKQKSGVSADLRPPETMSAIDDENTEDFSQMPINNRKQQPNLVGSPSENIRNRLITYRPFMEHMFGTLTDELSAHVSGEVTADKAFKDAMNPLS